MACKCWHVPHCFLSYHLCLISLLLTSKSFYQWHWTCRVLQTHHDFSLFLTQCLVNYPFLYLHSSNSSLVERLSLDKSPSGRPSQRSYTEGCLSLLHNMGYLNHHWQFPSDQPGLEEMLFVLCVMICLSASLAWRGLSVTISQMHDGHSQSPLCLSSP